MNNIIVYAIKRMTALDTATTNLNIRIDKVVKNQAEEIFDELGLNMAAAIKMFLKTTIMERGIPFDLKLNAPNDVTASVIEEGRTLSSMSTALMIETCLYSLR